MSSGLWSYFALAYLGVLLALFNEDQPKERLRYPQTLKVGRNVGAISKDMEALSRSLE